MMEVHSCDVLSLRQWLRASRDRCSVETFLKFGTRLEDYAFICEQGKLIRGWLSMERRMMREWLLRRSNFEPVLDALLSGCGACFSHR